MTPLRYATLRHTRRFSSVIVKVSDQVLAISRYSSLTEIMEAGLVDVILSFGFAFLFFTLAFVTFNRYDVRP